MPRVDWTRDQLLVACNLYFRLPFGRMHSRNPEIIETATLIGRTSSALAMKLCNLASLDPAEKARQVSGLKGASNQDRAVWNEFHVNWERLAFESEQAKLRFAANQSVQAPRIPEPPKGPTEAVRETRVRLVQGFFRQAVLTSYESRCAICLISEERLLIASHIMPWSVDENRRADPSNGLALCALHDRAFDLGLIGFSHSLTLLVSPRLKTVDAVAVHRAAFLDLEGRALFRPIRCEPDLDAIAFHRETVFGRM